MDKHTVRQTPTVRQTDRQTEDYEKDNGFYLLVNNVFCRLSITKDCLERSERCLLSAVMHYIHVLQMIFFTCYPISFRRLCYVQCKAQLSIPRLAFQNDGYNW